MNGNARRALELLREAQDLLIKAGSTTTDEASDQVDDIITALKTNNKQRVIFNRRTK
jgi:polyhydroxyalkanoate synthesis regulator phasin